MYDDSDNWEILDDLNCAERLDGNAGCKRRIGRPFTSGEGSAASRANIPGTWQRGFVNCNSSTSGWPSSRVCLVYADMMPPRYSSSTPKSRTKLYWIHKSGLRSGETLCGFKPGSQLIEDFDSALLTFDAESVHCCIDNDELQKTAANKTKCSVGGSCTLLQEGIVESSSESERSKEKARCFLERAGPGLSLDGLPCAVNEPSKNKLREVENTFTWNEGNGIQSDAASQKNASNCEDSDTVRLNDGDGAAHRNWFAILSAAALMGFVASILALVSVHKLAVTNSSRSRRNARFRKCLTFLVCVGLLCSTTAKSNKVTRLHTRKLSSVTVSSFKQLRDAVANAPTDGTQTIIDIEGDQMEWASGDGQDDTDPNFGSIVVVNSGANVVIRGSNDQTRTILDAKASSSSKRRFFKINEGATLEISNLMLQNGYVASD